MCISPCVMYRVCVWNFPERGVHVYGCNEYMCICILMNVCTIVCIPVNVRMYLLKRIPQELDPTPPTPSQSFSNMSSLAQTSFQHEGVHLGRVNATIGETVQGGSVVTSLREQEARESYQKDTAGENTHIYHTSHTAFVL